MTSKVDLAGDLIDRLRDLIDEWMALAVEDRPSPREMRDEIREILDDNAWSDGRQEL